MNKLFYLIVLLITYGSFFPFEFSTSFFTDELWEKFWRTWSLVSSRGDIISNIVLFIPYGAIGMIKGGDENNGLQRFLKLLFSGAVFSLLLQIGQFWLPDRSPELQDVFWNVAGILLGGSLLINGVIAQYIKTFEADLELSFPKFLLAAWLATLWVPFVPTLDLQSVRDALKPLFLEPEFEFSHILFQMSAWLVFIGLWQSIKPAVFGVKNIYWFLPVSLIIQLFLVGGQLTLSEVIGGILALIIQWIWRIEYVHKSKFLLALILFTIMFDGITPLVAGYNEFIWLPFEGFLTGSMLVNASVLSKKFFLYGSILWLGYCAGYSWRRVWLLSTCWILMIECIQSFQIMHTAEITDILYFLIIALYLKPRWVVAETEHKVTKIPAKVKGNNFNHRAVLDTKKSNVNLQNIQRAVFPVKKSHNQQAIILLVGGVFCISLAIFSILKIPNIPYNVKEMFSGNGSIFYIIFFALSLAWNGIGCAFFSVWIIGRSNLFWSIPVAIFGVSFISYLITIIGLTHETIMDVTGSANINYLMMGKKIWGDLGAAIFHFINSDFVILEIERLIRYIALTGPLFLFIVITMSSFHISCRMGSGGIKYFLKCLLYAAPWFLLFKYIAFDASSTDNLNELIERPGEFGLGGGGYLYLLVFIFSLNAVLVGGRWISVGRQSIVNVLFTVAMLPLGWWLLNQGLVSSFTKYNTTYSGVDFLLGPDRLTSLSSDVLILRWCILYLAMVISIAWGIRIFQLQHPVNA